jgi:Rps23 Pro-64 3,4-dihydroxylase Tpa1-like proline 4-hydroxylase
MVLQNVLFSKEECDTILSLSKEFKKSSVTIPSTSNSPHKFTRSYSKEYRDSLTSNVDCLEIGKIILPKISLLDDTIISTPAINMNTVKYKQGHYFKKHQDRSSDGYFERKKTLIIQLSEEDAYKGGSLRVWEKEGTPYITALKEIGNTIIFDSGYYHEVTTLEVGERHVLVCWLEDNNLK